MTEQGDLDRRCTATTSRGKPCRLRPVTGHDLCVTHLRSAGGMSRTTGAVPQGGRPDTITEDKVQEFERLLTAGTYIETACAVVGVPRSTFNDWMVRGRKEGVEHRAYQLFRERIEAAMAKFEARHAANIAHAGVQGDWRASAWLLERTSPERYAKPSQRAHAQQAVGPTVEGQANAGSGIAGIIAAAQRGTQARNQG